MSTYYRINYGQVIGQADRMIGLSDDLGAQIDSLEELLNDTNTSWESPAAYEYKRHVQMLISDLRQTKHQMSSVSSTIKNVARRIRDEDEELARRARMLSSGGGRHG